MGLSDNPFTEIKEQVAELLCQGEAACEILRGRLGSSQKAPQQQ